MNDLTVEVRHQDITVTKPGTGLCVTYRRVANEPVLEALCSMRGDPDAKALKLPRGSLEGRPRQSEGAWLACTLTGRNRAEAD